MSSRGDSCKFFASSLALQVFMWAPEHIYFSESPNCLLFENVEIVAFLATCVVLKGNKVVSRDPKNGLFEQQKAVKFGRSGRSPWKFFFEFSVYTFFHKKIFDVRSSVATRNQAFKVVSERFFGKNMLFLP